MVFPKEAMNEEGTLKEGWKLSEKGLVSPEGKEYVLEGGKFSPKDEEPEEEKGEKRPLATHVNPRSAAEIIARANQAIQRLETIPERLSAAEKKLEELQKFWSDPKNRKVEPKEPVVEFKEARGLFVEKGLKGLEEAVRRPTQDERIKQIQQYWDDLLIIDGMLRGYAQANGRPVHDVRSLKAYQRLKNCLEYYGFDLEEAIQKEVVTKQDAMSTATASAGGAWVPTGWSSEMIEYYRLARSVPGLFETIQMPTDPYRPPVQSGRVSVYNAGEATAASATAITASTIPTSYVEFSAQKPAGRVVWSGEMDEDSIVPMLPTLRRELPTALAEAIEDCIINGVIAGTTHLDSDIDAAGSDDWRKMWNGLRYHANQNGAEYDVTSGTTSYEYNDHVQGRMLMGKYAGLKNPTTEFAWILSFKAFLLASAFNETKSADYVGLSKVTGLTGVVEVIGGAPVFVSEFVRQDLNASGVYDGTTTTYTEAIGVFRPGWQIGDRRRETIEVTRIARTDQYEIVIMKRADFKPVLPVSSGESLSCVLYAIS